MITADSPLVNALGSVSKGQGEAFDRIGLQTVGDLLHYFPRRYWPMGELATQGSLEEGELLTVMGEVTRAKQFTYQDRRTGRPAYRVVVDIATGAEPLSMTFFSKKTYIAEFHLRQLAVGTKGLFIGKAGRFNNGWQLTNPQMVLFRADAETSDDRDIAAVEALSDLYPVYPLTKGLLSWDLHKAITFALSVVEPLPDVFPASVLKEHDLPGVDDALRLIHQPNELSEVRAAQRRFRFEEALVTQLVLARRRRAVRALGAQSREGGGGLLAAFDQRLPFELTQGQQQIGAQIEDDLAQPHPMNRLLQGEVGSGKTLVALRAMLRLVDSGGQAALLAPTEVLAQQHYRSITALLGDLAGGGMLGGAPEATGISLLTGSMTKTQRREPMLRIATGEAGIVIGTHALLEDLVDFHDLGLVVVDEQHRFGVEQRAALTDKAAAPPHVLVMTATPIPRTVAMTVFGDLEVSTLSELPAGRAAIQTNNVNLVDHPSWIDRAWQRVREEVDKGHQVYVVCPRISGDESEQGEADFVDVDEDGEVLTPQRAVSLAAVNEIHADLTAGPLQGLRVSMLHGKLPADDKDATMRAFAAGEVDVLVATTVIEVGVDVPNATMMVILDADRFGISQLHQLRGRVGRGGLPGLCLLVSQADPLSPARERLEVVAATSDGFELSQADLEQRREGDVLGKSQSGFRSRLTHLKVLRDEDTIRQARIVAEDLIATDPDLANAPLLAAEVLALEESQQADYMAKS